MSRRLVLGAGTLAVVAVWAATVVGWWWAALPVAALLGGFLPARGWAWTTGLASGLLGWALPLAWVGRSGQLLHASTDLSSLMGYHFGPLAIVVTVLVGTLLGLCGVWLGRVVRSWVAPSSHR